MTCTVDEIFSCDVGTLTAGFLGFHNLTTKHAMTKLITSSHSESNARSNDINIVYYGKYPKTGEIPLL